MPGPTRGRLFHRPAMIYTGNRFGQIGAVSITGRTNCYLHLLLVDHAPGAAASPSSSQVKFFLCSNDKHRVSSNPVCRIHSRLRSWACHPRKGKRLSPASDPAAGPPRHARQRTGRNAPQCGVRWRPNSSIGPGSHSIGGRRNYLRHPHGRLPSPSPFHDLLYTDATDKILLPCQIGFVDRLPSSQSPTNSQTEALHNARCLGKDLIQQLRCDGIFQRATLTAFS